MTKTDAPVTVEQIDWVERFAKSPLTTIEEHDAIMKVVRFARHRLAALASAPAGDGVDEETTRAYFERGFMACYAWQYVAAGAQLSDAVLDHAWDNREQGGQLPALASARAERGDDHQYLIGPLTMDHVFKAASLTNMSDMQAVLDAIEVALTLQSPPAKAVS